MVINVENQRYCYYLGEEITTQQKVWYKENKRILRRYKAVAVSIQDGGVEHYDEYSIEERSFRIVNEIIMNKPVISIENIKDRKR